MFQHPSFIRSDPVGCKAIRRRPSLSNENTRENAEGVAQGCRNCGEMGHYAQACPTRRASAKPLAQATSTTNKAKAKAKATESKSKPPGKPPPTSKKRRASGPLTRQSTAGTAVEGNGEALVEEKGWEEEPGVAARENETEEDQDVLYSEFEGVENSAVQDQGRRRRRRKTRRAEVEAS